MGTASHSLFETLGAKPALSEQSDLSGAKWGYDSGAWFNGLARTRGFYNPLFILQRVTKEQLKLEECDPISNSHYCSYCNMLKLVLGEWFGQFQEVLLQSNKCRVYFFTQWLQQWRKAAQSQGGRYHCDKNSLILSSFDHSQVTGFHAFFRHTRSQIVSSITVSMDYGCLFKHISI